jgi:hypothetical protein
MLSIVIYLKKLIKDRLNTDSIQFEEAVEILKYNISLIISNTLSDICVNNFTITIQDLLNFKPICDNSKLLYLFRIRR